jgi:hypothetical protein
MVEELTRLMKERYLAGEDGEHVDYKSIDGDATLDSYWAKQMQQVRYMFAR